MGNITKKRFYSYLLIPSLALFWTGGCKLLTPKTSEIKKVTEVKQPSGEIKRVCASGVPTPQTLKPLLLENEEPPTQPSASMPPLNLKDISFKFFNGYDAYVSEHLGRVFNLLQYGLAPWGYQLNSSAAIGSCIALVSSALGGNIQQPVLLQRSVARVGQTVTVTSTRFMPNGTEETTDLTYDMNNPKVAVITNTERKKENPPPQIKPSLKLSSKFKFPQEELDGLAKFLTDKTRLPQLTILDVTNLVGDVDLVAASSISKQEVFFFLTGFLKKGNLANMETLMISSPEQQLKSKYLKATGVIGFEFLEGTTLPEPINFKKTFTTAIALKQELNIVVTNRLGNASPAVGIMSNRVLPITLSIPN